jgi:outer membrane protein insertion porin family
MRLSAVLVAVFTASATFGLSNSASGETSYSESAEETFAAVTPAPSIELPDRPIPELTQNPPQNRKAGKTSKGEALKIAEAPARGEGENGANPQTDSQTRPPRFRLRSFNSNPS